MKLITFHTLWGWSGGSYGELAERARVRGYDGLEAPVSPDPARARELQQALTDNGLRLLAEICTAGSYVPERHASLAEHYDSFKRKLDASMTLQPTVINCLAGCDAWPLAQSVELFGRMLEQAQKYGVSLRFETHRSRTLFNPWICRDVVQALPDIRLTCDFSHWCAVCERLIDTEMEALLEIVPHAGHIHARVGYDQGPQVPHPAAPEYAPALAAHQRWWEMCWQAISARGEGECTLTPEFGPDGYLHLLPFTGMPVGDLWQINGWMLDTERQHFADWLKRR